MNEHQRRAEAMKAARSMAQARAQVGPLDRTAASLQVGDTVIFDNDITLFAQITKIQAVMDPNMPPGLVDLVIQVLPIPLRIPAGQPYGRLTVYRRAEPPESTAEKLAPSPEMAESAPALVGPDGRPI
jgi:hypothetical protein